MIGQALMHGILSGDRRLNLKTGRRQGGDEWITILEIMYTLCRSLTDRLRLHWPWGVNVWLSAALTLVVSIVRPLTLIRTLPEVSEGRKPNANFVEHLQVKMMSLLNPVLIQMRHKELLERV